MAAEIQPAHPSTRTGSRTRSRRTFFSTRIIRSIGIRGARRRLPKRARENKPIFLSIGYSTCHWCHVMAHESFENEEAAAIMNREFVNIKVDREERPDVDRVYMTFVQATTGGGGWPMSVWLTPDLKPFVGGTYFPPEDRYGQPAFKKVLEKIAAAWKAKSREDCRARGRRSLMRCANRKRRSPPLTGKDRRSAVLEAAYEQLDRSYDPKEGGFGNAPKFPRPVDGEFPDAVLRARSEERMLANKRSKWSCSRCAKWRRAECTITSAADFIVTRSIVTGTCRTSKKCSTIRRNSLSPISTHSKSRTIRAIRRSSRARHSRLCRSRHDFEGRRIFFRRRCRQRFL